MDDVVLCVMINIRAEITIIVLGVIRILYADVVRKKVLNFLLAFSVKKDSRVKEWVKKYFKFE